jgi:4-amino-4-deoxy-L-arabinose transferase-like glycosyltransferase
VKKNHKLLFILILFLGIFFRLWNLGTLPSSLNWDEISHGYNSYSLLSTGKDQWGISYPVFNFRAYGDFPTTLNLYLTIPFIKIFDLTPFAIRLPTVIFSILFIIYTFLFTKIIFKQLSLALVAMSLAAFLPWSFFPSRGVFQSTFSQTLILMGIYYFYSSQHNKRHIWLSAFFLGLSTYSYHNARIIVPILIIFLTYVHQLKLSKNNIIGGVILSIFLIPNLINLFTPESFARNRWVGIINPNSVNLINIKRNNFQGPFFINRLINNRPVYFIQTTTLNIQNQFNPFPIFIQGTGNYQLAVPNQGFIYIIFLPFLYLGIFFGFKKKEFRALFWLMLICLIPAALTIGDFPVLRSSTALIFYIIFITYGISQLRLIPSIWSIVITFAFFLNYWQQYLAYNQHYSASWQYGYQSVVDLIKQNYNEYDQIVITKKYGEPHEFILFYWPWDPKKLLNDPRFIWDYHSEWYWVDQFDKFKFVNDWEIKQMNLSPKTLLITSPDNFPLEGTKRIKTINFLNNLPAFDIISYE